MKETPLVSICCITYNQEDFIKRTIDGFLAQAVNFPVEIIISDDHSTDLTREVIKKSLNGRMKNVSLVFHTKNLGAVNNFVDTIARAKGKYIAFCEGDDYWTDKLKLRNQVKFMEENVDCGLLFTDIDMVYDDTKETKHYAFKNELNRSRGFIEHLVSRGYIAPCSWLIRKKDLNLRNINDNSDATFAVALDMFAKNKVRFLESNTATYRIHDGSITNGQNTKKWSDGVKRTQLKYIKKYPELILESLVLGAAWASMVSDQKKVISEKNCIINKKQSDIIYLKKELNSVFHSRSYRFGMIILAPVHILRKITQRVKL